MRVQACIARYCEDVSWMADLPIDWDVKIYDKSEGGPRQSIRLGSWSSAPGPDRADVWPGATRLPNVGTEAHTYMWHIVEYYEALADYTVFLPGDAYRHVPDVVQQAVSGLDRGEKYVPFGRKFVCDARGRPHVPQGFDELEQAWVIFFPTEPMPIQFEWTGYSMFMVHRDRIHRFTLEQWKSARAWCQEKIHAIAMERMHDALFR